jgi:hypothetical protein
MATRAHEKREMIKAMLDINDMESNDEKRRSIFLKNFYTL